MQNHTSETLRLAISVIDVLSRDMDKAIRDEIKETIRQIREEAERIEQQPAHDLILDLARIRDEIKAVEPADETNYQKLATIRIQINAIIAALTIPNDLPA